MMQKQLSINIMLLSALILLSSCTPSRTAPQKSKEGISSKIHISRLEHVNSDGLYGPKDGLVALHYEFCIPRKPELKAEVQRIDPTIEISESSRGRIGCTKEQYLCLGHTSQKQHRQTLQRLAAKEYILRIEEAWFE